MSNILEIKNLSYGYIDGGYKRVIFENTSISFEENKFYAIVGESGSGKTTFLSLIAGLDEPHEGQILYKGTDIKKLGYERYRKNGVSMVFQNYNLITYLNAVDNVKTALSISGVNAKDEAVIKALDRFGINNSKAKRKVNKLSGGEQQRVAIARALLRGTDLLVCDEPTGNLDEETANYIVSLFKEFVRDYGKTIIVVTHNEKIALEADKVIRVDQKIKGLRYE